MMKIRQERHQEENIHAIIEKDRGKYKNNVLRRKNLGPNNNNYDDTMKSSKFQTPVKGGKGGGGSENRSMIGSTLKGGRTKSIKDGDNKFHPFSTNNLDDGMGGEDKGAYFRRISKYDMDRMTVDVQKLMREKKQKREEGNKECKEK
jgi:hypothetical protein